MHTFEGSCKNCAIEECKGPELASGLSWFELVWSETFEIFNGNLKHILINMRKNFVFLYFSDHRDFNRRKSGPRIFQHRDIPEFNLSKNQLWLKAQRTQNNFLEAGNRYASRPVLLYLTPTLSGRYWLGCRNELVSPI